ncbi:MAG: hypothetical protein R3A45_00335 [Bdellovibrionota bacterium]
MALPAVETDHIAQNTLQPSLNLIGRYLKWGNYDSYLQRNNLKCKTKGKIIRIMLNSVTAIENCFLKKYACASVNSMQKYIENFFFFVGLLGIGVGIIFWTKSSGSSDIFDFVISAGPFGIYILYYRSVFFMIRTDEKKKKYKISLICSLIFLTLPVTYFIILPTAEYYKDFARTAPIALFLSLILYNIIGLGVIALGHCLGLFLSKVLDNSNNPSKER